jgi:hypothetical protein
MSQLERSLLNKRILIESVAMLTAPKKSKLIPNMKELLFMFINSSVDIVTKWEVRTK